MPSESHLAPAPNGVAAPTHEWELARLRGDLTQATHEIAERHRREGVAVNHLNLRSGLILAVGNARRELVPSGISDDQVEQMIEVVVADYLCDAPSPEPAPAERPWPSPADDAAYRGLAGDFVRLVSPHSESDPVALLSHFLVMLGNVIGRTVFATADGARHYLNLFAVIVGATASGRKGSAWAQARRFFEVAFPDWFANCIASGLSSGEGLIYAVRDAVKGEPGKNGEPDFIDRGASDKRLLAVETELASALKAAGRQGNTLSAILRQSWDHGNLRTLTRNSPLKASDAHPSLVGHVTPDELRRQLDSTELGNGMANRFLFFCVQRSKFIPIATEPSSSAVASLVERARLVAEFAAHKPGQIRFTSEAEAAWIDVYPKLSGGRPGLLGAVLGRAEAQTLRLATLYAVLDRKLAIELPHLESALAIWTYCEKSAEFIFGDALGDPDADAVLSTLRTHPDGLTRTGINDLFGRHLSAARLERALVTLVKTNLARSERRNTAGRPAEVWRAQNGR